MNEQRLDHLLRFYSILDTLEKNLGGAQKLADCSGRMGWPKRGAYFFRETGEMRADTGDGPRVVRIGTHALKTGGSTKLWDRLSAHKGQNNGGGNHRGSVESDVATDSRSSGSFIYENFPIAKRNVLITVTFSGQPSPWPIALVAPQRFSCGP